MSELLPLVIIFGPFLLVMKLLSLPPEDFKKFRYWWGNYEKRILSRINQHHPFYLSLAPWQRKEFLFRIFYFLETTEFVIKFSGDHNKIKTTIGYFAAQISFALPIQSFDLYHKVIVYEDDYYSQINQRYHKGEVNPGAGIMIFSWNAIQYGISKSNDGINLLLHEFAHALRLEHVMMDYNIFDEDHFEYMDNLSKSELERMYATEDHFFRRYASTNIDEFFAVASESFFERAGELKEKMPELYRAYKNLYNQDPLGRQLAK